MMNIFIIIMMIILCNSESPIILKDTFNNDFDHQYCVISPAQ